jgi:hypothetical protein
VNVSKLRARGGIGNDTAVWQSKAIAAADGDEIRREFKPASVSLPHGLSHLALGGDKID